MFKRTYTERTHYEKIRVQVLKELDKVLCEASSQLFELDKHAREILRNLTDVGPSTVYALSIKNGLNLSRPMIYRRMNGDGEQVSLVKEEFVKLVEVKKKPINKKSYGVTLKGLFASLADGNILEEKHPFKEVWLLCEKECPNDTARQAGLDYIKSQLAVWMQFHLDNGLRLTHLKNTRSYFSATQDLDTKLPLRYNETEGELVGSQSKQMLDLQEMKAETSKQFHEIMEGRMNGLKLVFNWPMLVEVIHILPQSAIVKLIERQPNNFMIYPSPTRINVNGDAGRLKD
jgi:hypothetical protein